MKLSCLSEDKIDPTVASIAELKIDRRQLRGDVINLRRGRADYHPGDTDGVGRVVGFSDGAKLYQYYLSTVQPAVVGPDGEKHVSYWKSHNQYIEIFDRFFNNVWDTSRIDEVSRPPTAAEIAEQTS